MAADDEDKILTSIKAALGLQPDYTPFDVELLMHINSVLSILGQLGVGPATGFVASDQTAWKDLLPDEKIENAKAYIFLRVKMLFDPASLTPAMVASYEKQIEELGFRIMVAKDPLIPWEQPEIDEDDVPIIIDGGEI